MGGAMLAMVACGEYKTVNACCEKLCAVADVVKPEPELVAKYEKCYQQFQKIYPACKELFAELM
jgi:xylulokinase